MRKRILSMLLTLTLALGLCAIPAQAAEVSMMEPSVETSLNERQGADNCVLKSNGELWVYSNDYDTVGAKLVMTDVLAISSRGFSQAYVVLALQKNGNLWHCEIPSVYDVQNISVKTSLITSNVRQLQNTCYLTADGTPYQYKGVWDFDNNRESYVSQRVAEDVISFSCEAAYVTSDHVLHYQRGTAFVSKRGFSQVKGFRGETYFSVSDDGALYSWGQNSFGETGTGNGYDYSEYNNGANYDTVYVLDPTKVLDHVSQLSQVTIISNSPRWQEYDLVNDQKHCIYVRDDSGVLWQWGDAPKRTSRYNYADFITPADPAYCTPRRSASAAPVFVNVNGFRVGSDGYLYACTSGEVRAKLPVKLSEVMGVGGSAPVEPVIPTKPGNFTDVPANAYYADAVKWAVENGITAGTTSTTFSPNQTCSRAQIMTFLWRAAGSPESHATGNPYTDVSPGAYYYKACQWGYEDIGADISEQFRPNVPCTRSTAVSFIWSASGHPEVKADCPFTDVDQSSHMSGIINWAVEQGITAGTSATTFSPNNTCTRAQIVTFLYRAFA